MAIIRKVFGPFKFEAFKDHEGYKASWHFNGIRDDYSSAHWKLVYNATTRTFRAHSIQSGGLSGAAGKVAAHLPNGGINELIHPSLFLKEGESVMSGTITDILKSKLKPEDIAMATAMAIARRQA